MSKSECNLINNDASLSNVKSIERERYIDVSKAFGMFAVVWGHIALVGCTNYFVYSFSIPLFFFLSGFCYNSKKYQSFIMLVKSRIKGLLIPYLLFAMVTYAFWIMCRIALGTLAKECLDPFWQIFIAQGSAGYLIHNVALWFVPCLFLVEIVFYFISKCNNYIKVFVGLALAVIGYLMIQENTFFDFTKLPWSIEVVPSAMIFYITGNLVREKFGFKKMPSFVKEHKLICYIISILLVVFLAVFSQFNGHVTMGSNCLGNPFLFYFNGYIGIIGIIALATSISVSLQNKNIFSRYFNFVGENSFYFMALHCPVISVLNIVCDKALPILKINPPKMCIWVAIFVITIISTSIGIAIINKIKVKFKLYQRYVGQ